MIVTPKEAKSRRDLKSNANFIKHVGEIDALLEGQANTARRGVPAWAYEFPLYRDSGVLRKAVQEAYEKAGWYVDFDGGHLYFADQAIRSVE